MWSKTHCLSAWNSVQVQNQFLCGKPLRFGGCLSQLNLICPCSQQFPKCNPLHASVHTVYEPKRFLHLTHQSTPTYISRSNPNTFFCVMRGSMTFRGKSMGFRICKAQVQKWLHLLQAKQLREN